MSPGKERFTETENAATNEKTKLQRTVAAKAGVKAQVPAVQPDFQVRRPDTLLFATLEGLQKQSGVSVLLLRRLVLNRASFFLLHQVPEKTRIIARYPSQT
jgi:hypothetical protein